MTPGFIRKAWVKRGPWISALGGACDKGEVYCRPLSSSPLGGQPADGGHDAAESLTQLQGGVGGQLGRVVEAFDFRRAVQ